MQSRNNVVNYSLCTEYYRIEPHFCVRASSQSSIVGGKLVALVLGTAHGVLHRATNASIRSELLANSTLLVEGSADALSGSSECTLLCVLVSRTVLADH